MAQIRKISPCQRRVRPRKGIRTPPRRHLRLDNRGLLVNIPGGDPVANSRFGGTSIYVHAARADAHAAWIGTPSPMCDSNLIRVLQAQTSCWVGHIAYDRAARGKRVICACTGHLRAEAGLTVAVTARPLVASAAAPLLTKSMAGCRHAPAGRRGSQRTPIQQMLLATRPGSLGAPVSLRNWLFAP